MKILSLNTWHGERGEILRDYLLSQLDAVDIFCFQETNSEYMRALLAELFHTQYFSSAKAEKITDTERHYSLRTFIKKPYVIESSEALFEDSDAETGQALATKVQSSDGGSIVIINTHGIPFKVDDKLDTEGRLRQTDKIIQWAKSYDTAGAVICGDFNLLPQAKSVTNFEVAGFRNLISDYEIPTTRNKLAWDRWPDNMQYFADYTFVSSGLQVISFDVPANEVSDHLPMVVEIAN